MKRRFQQRSVRQAAARGSSESHSNPSGGFEGPIIRSDMPARTAGRANQFSNGDDDNNNNDANVRVMMIKNENDMNDDFDKNDNSNDTDNNNNDDNYNIDSNTSGIK